MIQENPNSWPDDNTQWISPVSYALMVEFSFQIAILFLLQCFWNYVSNSIAKASLMSRFEFKLYVFLGVVSAFLFPVLQAAFSNIATLREAIPQLIYGAQLIVLTVLGTVSGGNSLNSTIHDSMSSQPTKPYTSGLGLDVDRDSYARLSSYNNNTDRCIESDKFSSNDSSSNESPISSQMLPAAPTPIISQMLPAASTPIISSQMLPAAPAPIISPPNSISSNSAPSIAKKTKLKRNISLSRDGKMIYGDTEPLGKVGGSEFVAVEKVDDPSIIPYYFSRDQQFSKPDEHDPRKSTQEERMLVLQRQHDEFNVLRMNAMRSQQSLLLNDENRSVSSSAMRSQQSVLLNNDSKSVSSSANTFIEDQQALSASSHAKRTSGVPSVLSNVKRSSEAISYEESDDGYFYAM
ncbi:17572_t:CDS:2 [Racocetra persica]|uniref:17572_t:CDS:1 n=2 Tax=Racocetra persica TaxID=160502 RepID=A0ACA9KRJ6_9GLOM|nr:17571_t:CDS:2 [Racocetra persica]CAG8486208.1 17572_t:CDS:2 [Racocetra persica]